MNNWIRELHLGDLSGHKSIKKRCWNPRSVFDALFTDFGPILMSFWEAKNNPKRSKIEKKLWFWEDVFGRFEKTSKKTIKVIRVLGAGGILVVRGGI